VLDGVCEGEGEGEGEHVQEEHTGEQTQQNLKRSESFAIGWLRLISH